MSDTKSEPVWEDDDVWAEDGDFNDRPASVYNWPEKARIAVQRPGKWLLVSADAPPTSAGNVNGGRVTSLLGPDFAGYRFTARVSDVYVPDPEHPSVRRCKLWLKADEITV